MMRRIMMFLLAGVMMFTLTACPYTPVQERVQSHINYSRTHHDLRRLPLNLTLSVKAQRWANHLAACNCLEHSNLADGAPPSWRSLAENVGWISRDGSGTLIQMHKVFMRSPHHRANVLGRRWTHVGTGVATNRTRLYVVHEFCEC
jgi:uncharacterized protein YkwD